MTVYMTNREICLKAAERLREVGWQQGDFGGADGPHCMLGACMWVTGYDDVTHQVVPTDVAEVAGGAAYAAFARLRRCRRGRQHRRCRCRSRDVLSVRPRRFPMIVMESTCKVHNYGWDI